MFRQGFDEFRLEVLTGSGRHVVDDGRAKVEHTVKVFPQPFFGRFSVVGIDLEGGIHTEGKTVTGGFQGFTGVVAAGIADDHEFITEAVDTVGDEHQVFFPVHQMAFSGGSADNQPFHSIAHLFRDQFVITVQVDLTPGFVRGFDGGHQACVVYLFFHSSSVCKGFGRYVVVPLGQGAFLRLAS